MLRDLLPALIHEAEVSLQPGRRRVEEWARDKLNELPAGLQPRWRTEDSVRNQWRRVLRRSRESLEQLPAIAGPRVLVATMFGLDRSTAVLDSVLITALRLRGADPIGLMCDGAIPACEFNPFGAYDPDPGPFGPRLFRRGRLDRCRQCTKGLADAYGVLPAKMARLSAYSIPGDLGLLERIVDAVDVTDYRGFHYRDVGVGEHAYASVTRALKRGTLDDTARTRWMYRRYLVSSMWIVDMMERLIEHMRPERVVATHGIYVTQGTIADVARKHGIPRAIGGSTYRTGTVSLFQDDCPHRAQHAEPTALWDTLELTPAMDRRLDDYLHVRRGGGDDYNNYHRDSVADRSAVFRELDLDPRKPLVTLFSNLLWDAQILFHSKLYPDMVRWVAETIRYFDARPDIQLAIRMHPSDGRRFSPSAQPLSKEVERLFPRLPDNVRVVSSDSHINSYALADMSEAALIYGARWGFELAVQGVPIVITGESPNRGKGLSYDPQTTDEYFALLDRIPHLPRNSPELIRRARQYAYHYHFRLSIELPFTHAPDAKAADPLKVALRGLDELLPGRTPGLDVICQGILDGTTPFIHDDL